MSNAKMKMVAVMFDSDATTAYNRMIPSQCMIVAAHAGILVTAIRTKLRVLRLMQYYVKTVYGVLEDHFGNLLLLAILGLLQGSAAVVAIWHSTPPCYSGSLTLPLHWPNSTHYAYSFSLNTLMKPLLMIALFGTRQ